MTIHGRIKKGKVQLDDPTALPEGTEVIVRPKKPSPKTGKTSNAKARKQRQSLAERYASFVGKAKGLPADASVQHDHYLYGTPKRP